MKLLIVEDDDSLAEVLARGLSEEGFEVTRTADGARGLQAATTAAFGALILDWMLPEMDGVALCRRLRELGDHTPVLMLTVRSGVQDRVEGLSAGADDFLAKPFSFEELLARIRALIRRSGQWQGSSPSYAGMALDPSSVDWRPRLHAPGSSQRMPLTSWPAR